MDTLGKLRKQKRMEIYTEAFSIGFIVGALMMTIVFYLVI